MRVPIEWLREYVDVTMPVAELAERLNMLGLSPESVEGDDDRGVIHLEITSNRGDCLSMLGVAREVAAVTGAAVREPQFTVTESEQDAAQAVAVEIADLDLCPRYAARLIRGVKIGPSPAWMQQRLEAAGMRPINNIVDITNYVMLELGQPLHAFDNAKLAKDDQERSKIIVRRARPGERMTTLDDVERELTTDMLLITDPSGPIAIAGVMGGASTEVSWNTKDILLESAHFNAANNRRTAMALALPSEATRRFQRYVDPNGVIRAADRAAQLMAELAGGTVARGVVDVYPQPVPTRPITLRPARCNRLLGTELPAQRIAELLASLDLGVDVQSSILNPQSSIGVEVPTRRPDLVNEIDLVEEVARVYGYDRIASAPHRGVAEHAGENRMMKLERRAKDALVGLGLNEVVTYSLTNPEAIARSCIAVTDVPFVMRNPLSSDANQLRTSMLPSMLEVLSNNARVGIKDAHIFEIGRVYRRIAGEVLADERRTIVIGVMGGNWNSFWNLGDDTAKSDFFSLKGIVTELLSSLRVCDFAFEQVIRYDVMHPFRCARLRVDGHDAGYFGELLPRVADAYDLPGRVFVAHLDFVEIANAATEAMRNFEPLPRFPSVARDIAVLVDAVATAQSVEGAIRNSGGRDLRSIVVFDVFRGGTIPPGKKSLAFSLTFRADERTLTDAEVEAAMQQIRGAVVMELGAALR